MQLTKSLLGLHILVTYRRKQIQHVRCSYPHSLINQLRGLSYSWDFTEVEVGKMRNCGGERSPFWGMSVQWFSIGHILDGSFPDSNQDIWRGLGAWLYCWLVKGCFEEELGIDWFQGSQRSFSWWKTKIHGLSLFVRTGPWLPLKLKDHWGRRNSDVCMLGRLKSKDLDFSKLASSFPFCVL